MQTSWSVYKGIFESMRSNNLVYISMVNSDVHWNACSIPFATTAIDSNFSMHRIWGIVQVLTLGNIEAILRTLYIVHSSVLNVVLGEGNREKLHLHVFMDIFLILHPKTTC